MRYPTDILLFEILHFFDTEGKISIAILAKVYVIEIFLFGKKKKN